MKSIDFKNFSLQELYAILEEIKIMNVKDFKNNLKYSISDFLDFSVHQGSENLYLDITIYEVDGFDPITLKIYTKDNHLGLKQLITHITML